MNVIARIRKIQGCLYACNAAADDQYTADDILALGALFVCHYAFLMKKLIRKGFYPT